MKNILFLFLSICLISNAMAQSGRLSTQIGNIKSSTKINAGMAFMIDNGYASITTYGPTTIRVRVCKEKPAADFSYAIDQLESTYNFKSITDAGKEWVFLTEEIKLVINKKPFRVSFYNNNGILLNGDDESLGISWWGNQVSNYKKLHADEKFIGLGEKTGSINRRGQFYQHWNSDVPAYGLDKDPLYSTIPFFVGIHDNVSYGIFFDNTHHSYFNFGGGAGEELFHFGADDGEMNYYFFAGPTVENIIKDYTSLTGRIPMPPLWSLGYQQCRWGYESSAELLGIAKTLREKKLPADVVYMDITYMDKYKVFTWDPKNFADPKAMLEELKQMNFELVTIIDPGIKIEKGYKTYDEGVAQNHFAKYPDGRLYVGSVWPGRCNFPDFTKPATAKWWGNQFKSSLVDIGVKGFWNDMNEPAAWGREFPNLIEFGDANNKATLYTVKNAYGLLMSKATYEGTKSLMKGQRPFVLTRASYAGIQKYSAQWTGDNFASDDHMLLGQRLLNSMALSGVPYVGMDVGGFIGEPSAALYVRWMNLGIYSPLLRQHSEIASPRSEPWNFGEYNTGFIRGLLEQRYKMLPYLYSSFYNAHITGMPINRMLPISFTNEAKVYDDKYGNQFLFGDNLLVCPVDSKTFIADVYLPGNAGWYRFSNDEWFAGGKSVYVPSPLNDLPVFVKESAIIPMQSVIQSTKEKGDGILYVHIWKGKTANHFLYYEDDGNSFDYEKGAYYSRNINYDPISDNIVFNKKEGTYSSRFKEVKLVFHGFENLKNITFANSNILLKKEGNTFSAGFVNADSEMNIIVN
jgi:alpha-glucosidase